jgi:hypothetical protein
MKPDEFSKKESTWDMKRVLVSLALGLIIIPAFLMLLLIAKIINTHDYPTALLWIVIWPLPIMNCNPWFVPSAGRVLLVGTIGDYLFLSLLSYCTLTAGSRLRKRRVRLSEG